MNKEKNIVGLHCHTAQGSMLDAMTNVYDMFKKASELGQPALAISDHGTAASWFDARKASVKYGVKFLPAIEAYFVDDVKEPKQKRRHIVLIASNEKGYRNLLQLNYEGFLNFEYVAVMGKVFPRIDWNLLEKYNEGIICLTACGSGLISRQMFVHGEDGEWLEGACHDNVLKTAQRLKGIFGDNLYLEVQPHNLKIFERDKKTGEFKLKNGKQIVIVDQNHINNKLREVGKILGIRVVATTDIHYLNKEDAKAHDMLMAISSKAPLSDKMRHRYEVEEFYMKDYEEIHAHFVKYFDKEFADEVCDNTIRIANQCEDPVYLDPKGVRFPKFDTKVEDDYNKFLTWKAKNIKNNIPEDHAFMRFRCIQGFKKKFGHLKGESKKKYIDRMMDELKVLEQHNFCSYMLIVSDFIKKAKENKIFIGPGRGSVAGSLVGNLLDIHAVDPIKYGLLFERFHNKEKKAFPDIDTDISPDGREWVMEYITNKYGKEKVAHVSNLSRMTPKVVITDIARSLELGGDKSKAFEIAKKITDTIPATAKTIDEVLAASKEFGEYCKKYPLLEEYGRKLVGLEKAYATHAAGIVISDVDLPTYVPLRLDKNGDVSVQYEKNRCEEMGLIKMDLLGLEHLRIIKNTIENIRKLGLSCPEPEDIPLDDAAVWEDISKGKTMCVFQMESAHMKTLCKQVKPKSIEELSIVNALGRPSAGQKENGEKYTPRDLFISRRDNKEKLELKYKCLENSLGSTLGVCMYEEQLMTLAKDVAGWDLNEADQLRKITKLKEKGAHLVKGVEEKFINDAIKNDIKKEHAQDIWTNIILPYSKYGFNKSHSIAYSINGYHTAYYKHHFPAAFMTAVLEAENNKGSSPDRDANIREYKKECKKLGIKIFPPSINKSAATFSMVGNNAIIAGLEAIKGVGSSAVSNIIETRNKNKFVSFPDFLYRTKSSVVRKDVIQPLAQAGCFDELKITRRSAFNYYADIRTKANKFGAENEKLGIEEHRRLDGFTFDKPDLLDEWTKPEVIKAEMDTLGEAVSGSINDLYGGFFTGKGTTELSKLKAMPDGLTIKVETIISDVKQDKLKKGKNKGRTYAKFTITDDKGDTAQLTAWPDQWVRYREILDIGKPIRAVCRVNNWNNTNTLVLDRIENTG
jgi:DNA polymerase-3 subunit alpha